MMGVGKSVNGYSRDLLFYHTLTFIIYSYNIKDWNSFLGMITGLWNILDFFPDRMLNYIFMSIPHTGKCIRRVAGIYAYCWYFIDRKW